MTGVRPSGKRLLLAAAPPSEEDSTSTPRAGGVLADVPSIRNRTIASKPLSRPLVRRFETVPAFDSPSFALILALSVFFTCSLHGSAEGEGGDLKMSIALRLRRQSRRQPRQMPLQLLQLRGGQDAHRSCGTMPPASADGRTGCKPGPGGQAAYSQRGGRRQ